MNFVGSWQTSGSLHMRDELFPMSKKWLPGSALRCYEGKIVGVSGGQYSHVAVHGDGDDSQEEEEGVPHTTGRPPLEHTVARAGVVLRINNLQGNSVRIYY